MIYIRNNKGRKYIAINRNKRLYFNQFKGKSFIPYGNKFEPYVSGSFVKAKIIITNKLTGNIVEKALKIVREDASKNFVSTNRSTLYYFDYFDGMLDKTGTYTYEIIEYIADGSLNDAGKYFVTDRGELRIYFDETFTEPYINPDEQTIPATIVYKP